MGVFGRISASLAALTSGIFHTPSLKLDRPIAPPRRGTPAREGWHGRKRVRNLYRFVHQQTMKLGPPTLTGARLARVTEACSGKHLTVLGAARWKS